MAMINPLPNSKAAIKQGSQRKSRAWAWLLCPRAIKAQSRISTRDGSPDAVSEGASRREGGRGRAAIYGATCVDHSAGACTHAQGNQPQHTNLSSKIRAGGQTLPDPLLFSSIKSCSSWADCQRLLTTNAQQLDAMLLSTLVTQTVCVHQGHLQQEHDASSTWQAESETAAGRLHQQTPLQSQQMVSLTNHKRDATNSRVRRISRSRNASSKATCQHYLEQLAQVSLMLTSSFRPQQFSNVLWGLARCGYRPLPVFVNRYLAQAELQLVGFPPRNLAQLIWALATMRTKPPRSFLASFLAESSDRLAQFKPQDIANTLWALAILGVQPPADWLHSALSAAEHQWALFKPQELSITIWGLAKLGLGFKPQPASPVLSPGGGGLSPEGLMCLLTAAVAVLPRMSPQEVCNFLWGLAVGDADLAPQQVQVLAVHALRVLYNQQLTSSSGSSRSTGDSSQDLCVCVWALTRLKWTPTHQEAQLLLHLLQQQKQHWSSGFSSSRTASCRSAATLLWCFGKLRMRPPADFVQQVLLQVQQGLASPTATAADAIQALSGCRALRWRPSKTWWGGFYQESLGVLQEATPEELARVLLHAAALRPLQPTGPWWEAFWHQVGIAVDANFTAYGLKRQQDLAVSASYQHSQNSSSGTSKSCAGVTAVNGIDNIVMREAVESTCTAAAADVDHTAARRRRRRIASGDRPSRSSRVSERVSVLQQQQETLGNRDSWDLSAVLAGTEGPWLELGQKMTLLMRLRAAARPLGLPGHSRQTSHLARPDLINPQSTMMLLWACAKLKRLPRKKVLWQLLVLVLVELHHYTPWQLTNVMWSSAVLVARYGQHVAHCRTLLQLLVVGAQWLLHTELVGVAADGKYVSALRFLAGVTGFSGCCS